MHDTWKRMGPAVLDGGAAVSRPIALLEAMRPGDPPVVSWSTVTAPTLVLGRAARDPVLNHPALEAHGVTVTHRRSGGGPVLWDAGLVALDVVVPPGHPLALPDVTLSYRWLGELLAEALRSIGVPADVVGLHRARTLAARDDAVSVRANRACFGGVSPFEVLAPDDRKLVGLSQARRRTGTLFQCGILLDFDAALLAELLEPDPLERGLLATALAARATGICGRTRHIALGEVIRAIEDRLPGPSATSG